MKNNRIRKENGGLIFIGIVTLLCVIAILGIFAVLLYFEVSGSLADFQRGELRKSVNLLTWIMIGIDLAACATGWLFRFESEDAGKQEKTSRLNDPEKIEDGLETADYLLELFMMLTFLFIGIRFFLCSARSISAGIWMTVLLLAILAALWFTKKMLAGLSTRPRLNQKGNLRDERVIRERMIAYRSGYRTFKMMNRVLVGAMLLIMVLSRFTTSLATALFLEAGAVWAVMNGLFRLERRRLRKKG
ncbi:hypothetical protein NE619_01930 [Anaerovorax odorimutans]|uniref:DUF3169 family protein n=1 Tax=Anaerovorax odorimutans TaxID=109327 RepID=A0ABT1RJW8_9FIRM|nr:hypothetical protein [Anaerovorax odorimutans]MCQ4635476.1 hypothetical protein [Anaerovorax odorimutans]